MTSRTVPGVPSHCSACDDTMIVIEHGQVTHPACDLPDRGLTLTVFEALGPCARCGGQCVRYGDAGAATYPPCQFLAES